MAYSAFRQWPDTNTLIAALRAPLAAVPQGPDDGSLLVDTSGVAPFNPAIFGYYLPDATVGSSADPAAVANAAAGRYTVAVQKLDSAALEADALISAATPELRQAVLAAAKRDKVGAELATSGRYAITDVLPWTTTSPADPSGVFVIWTLKPVAS
jgi:hypothetical protein